MSQVSYGTITITDTTDIERIYIEYCRSTSNQLDTSVTPPIVPDITINWSENTPAWQSGEYIWQRSVIKKSGISDLVYGTPVCLTGAGGRSIEEIKTFYCNYGTGTPAEDYDGWSVVVPEYIETKPYYWIKTVIIYVDDSKEEITYTGNPIVIDDADGEVKSLNVELTPIQEGTGTPSPTNVRPIYPHTSLPVRDTGKNLWGGLKMAQDIVAATPNASIDTTTKTVTYNASDITNKVLFSSFKANKRYTFIMKQATGSNHVNMRVHYTDATDSYFPASGVLVTEANKTIESLLGTWITGTSILLYEECGVFEGVLSESDFAPYTGQTVTVPLNDLYGGNVDVIGGQDGEETWGFFTATSAVQVIQHTSGVYYTVLSSNLTPQAELNGRLMSNMFVQGYLTQGEGYCYLTGGGLYLVAILPQSITTKAQADEWLVANEPTFAYELATPTPLTTTPTALTLYKGDNVVSSDGDMTMDYYSIAGRDVQIHLDNGLTEAIAQSVEANNNAAEALNKANEAESIAQHANENAQGAMSQAAATPVAQEALASKLKRIWINEVTSGNYLAGTYAASGINGVTFSESNPSSYGFNSLLRHNYLSFRYNTYKLVTIGTGVAVDSDSAIGGVAINVPIVSNGAITNVAKGMELTANTLKFYQPPTISGSTVTDGALAMELSGDALKFYKTDSTIPSMLINTNGIIIGEKQDDGVSDLEKTNYLQLTSSGFTFNGRYSLHTPIATFPRFGVIASLGYDSCIGPADSLHFLSSLTDNKIGCYDSNSALLQIESDDIEKTNANYQEKQHVIVWDSTNALNTTFYMDYIGGPGDLITWSMIISDKTKTVVQDWRNQSSVTENLPVSFIINNVTYTINVTIYQNDIAPASIKVTADAINNGIITITADTTYTMKNYGPFIILGQSNESRGTNAIALGSHNIAKEPNQLVMGQYNEPLFNAQFIIGNGTNNNNRSNLFVIDGNGNLSVKDGFKIISNTNAELILNSNGIDIKQNNISLASFTSSGAVIGQTADGNYAVIDEDSFDIYHGNTEMVHFGYGEGNTERGTAIAPYYTSGTRRTTTTEYSASNAYAVGDLCVHNNKLYVCKLPVTAYQGGWSSADWQLAIGNYSVAGGKNVIASGFSAHAEGASSAIGSYSHTEGEKAIAAGSYAHAEGYSTKAIGDCSHAQNTGTYAQTSDQTAIGRYNEIDGGVPYGSGIYAFIIGNGTSVNARSNAFTVGWNGNTIASGDITDGSGNTLSAKVDKSSLFNLVYPVGSIYTTSTNTNPSTYFGGTWELIDKELAFQEWYDNTGANISGVWTWNSTYTQNASSGDSKRNIAIVRKANNIYIRIGWYNKTAISDSVSATIGTLDLSGIGLTNCYAQYVPGISDGLNAILITHSEVEDGTVTISTTDWITRAASLPTTIGSYCNVQFQLMTGSFSNYLDAACDRFTWKRTS